MDEMSAIFFGEDAKWYVPFHKKIQISHRLNNIHLIGVWNVWNKYFRNPQW